MRKEETHIDDPEEGHGHLRNYGLDISRLGNKENKDHDNGQSREGRDGRFLAEMSAEGQQKAEADSDGRLSWLFLGKGEPVEFK